MENNFENLIHFLATDQNWEKFGPELALISPGNWNTVVKWATNKGFCFTAEEAQSIVKQINPETIEAIIAQDSQLKQWFNS
ncbi:hypothetical protein [Tenacibaculum sp. 190524A02b]|uniref:Nif11 domain-containing protein n=1 Tax=Tenacibaculum vairaonense TaxID=3137860 RepID=A0ABP1FDR0_9FLAO